MSGRFIEAYTVLCGYGVKGIGRSWLRVAECVCLFCFVLFCIDRNVEKKRLTGLIMYFYFTIKKNFIHWHTLSKRTCDEKFLGEVSSASIYLWWHFLGVKSFVSLGGFQWASWTDCIYLFTDCFFLFWVDRDM